MVYNATMLGVRMFNRIRKVFRLLNPVFVTPYPIGTKVMSEGGYNGKIIRHISKELGEDFCYEVAFPSLHNFVTPMLHSNIKLVE